MRNGLIRSFVADEAGAGHVWNIFWCIVFLLMAGLAIDSSNAHRTRMVLQVTADSAALAAVQAMDRTATYENFTGNDGDQMTATERGKATAIALAHQIMYPDRNGDVLVPADVRFGTYDRATRAFVEGTGNAVQVTVRRSSANGNALPTTLLRVFGGLQSWDIAAVSIAERYLPGCSADGIITSDRIDFQSNNAYSGNICLHGNAGVEANQNNTYETGVIVSMEDLNNLVVPGDDLSKNVGLADALREGFMAPHLANIVETIIADIDQKGLGSGWLPPGIDNIVTVAANGQSYTPSAGYQPNTLYNITCTGGNMTLNLRGNPQSSASLLDQITNIRFAAAGGNGNGNGNGGGNGNGNGGGNGGGTDGSDTGETGSNGNGNGGNGGNGGGNGSSQTVLKDVVVVTNCDIALDSDTILDGAMVATSSTAAQSVKGSSGVAVGRPDNCLPGGGSQILTAGGMHFAAKMSFHGSQLVAAGSVKMAAQVDGLAGTSIESRGRVDLASNNAAALCEGTVDPVLPVYRYRLLR